MSELVTLKSNRYGINLVLDPNAPFISVREAVIEKFKESEKFFKNAKIGLSFEGRRMSDEEELKLIDAIQKNSTVEVICIIDSDPDHEEHTKRLVEKAVNEGLALSQAPAPQAAPAGVMQSAVQAPAAAVSQAAAVNAIPQSPSLSGDFHRGTLRSGQYIESEGSVTVIGDVNPGAHITAAGNVVILGALKGNVQAGCFGDDNAFVFALTMDPIQIQIGEYIAKRPDEDKKPKKRLRKPKKEQTEEAQIAIVKEGAIYIESAVKSVLRGI